jgi:plastocyanin domain-containing protein
MPRRLARIAVIALVRGTATAAGTALITLATWWITHR